MKVVLAGSAGQCFILRMSYWSQYRYRYWITVDIVIIISCSNYMVEDVNTPAHKVAICYYAASLQLTRSLFIPGQYYMLLAPSECLLVT